MQIKQRSIIMAILLTIITCGIYGIYWFVVMTDDVATISHDESLSGVKSLVFAIITCGIYYYYWNYKMGQRLAEAKYQREAYSDDKGVLFLILAIFGFSIVNYCLIQDELNHWAVGETL